MIRQLLPNWQFLLLSSIRRGVWAADPDHMTYERELAIKLLESGSLPHMDALPSEIEIFAAAETDNEDEQERKCAVINIVGTMLRYGTLCSYGADEYAAMLHEVQLDSSISAVVLNIDSGGGDARAVAPIMEAINAVKAVKPILASVDFCASAAYWIASACDKIFSQNTITSTIGSIGTYTEIVDNAEYLKQNGFRKHTIYATASTDKNKAYQDSINEDYTTLRKEILDPLNNAFVAGVRTNRPGVSESVFSGKMYFSGDAESLGLIDGVKNLSQTISYAQELAIVQKFTNQ